MRKIVKSWDKARNAANKKKAMEEVYGDDNNNGDSCTRST